MDMINYIGVSTHFFSKKFFLLIFFSVSYLILSFDFSPKELLIRVQNLSKWDSPMLLDTYKQLLSMHK